MDFRNTTETFFSNMDENDWGYLMFGAGITMVVCCAVKCVSCLCCK